ncbi:MAG: tetratricopeptide repeat protein [Saprospiraceae bacterium]|nr:tetratricopeptide repeat protein [Saprospiraceae bacterium]
MKNSLVLFLFFLLQYAAAQNQDSLAAARQIDSLIQLNLKLSEEREFDAALNSVDTAIELAGRAFGDGHIIYSDCLSAKGLTLFKMARYKEVEPLYMQAKSIREKALGKDAAKYLQSLINLGNLYAKNGQNKEAEAHYLNAREGWEKLSGKETSDYATSIFNLAILYVSMGRRPEAENFTKRPRPSVGRCWDLNIPIMLLALLDLDPFTAVWDVTSKQSLIIWRLNPSWKNLWARATLITYKSLTILQGFTKTWIVMERLSKST